MRTLLDAARVDLAAEIKAIRADAEATRSRLEPILYRLAEMVTREAGLDPYCMTQHIHNAQVSNQEGRPWPGVDYRLVALADLILNRVAYLPDRLVAIMFDLQCLADPTYPAFSNECTRRKVEEGRHPYFQTQRSK